MASDAQTAAAAHASGGLPQIDFTTWPSQIVWLVITFVLLYFIMSVFALPRIQSTLEERQDTIANDLDLAAEYDRKAFEAEAAYKASLEKARAEARRISDKNQEEIKAQLDVALAEAETVISEKTVGSRERLNAIRAEASAKAEEVATSVAEALVARFSSAAVDAGEVRASVSREIQNRFQG